jgi:hypothetical protein
MEILEIPIQPIGTHFVQQSVLAGSTYTFEFEWMKRGGFWMLHIGDANGAPLISGVKIVPEWPLLRRDLNAMPGQLMALMPDGKLKLFYVTF